MNKQFDGLISFFASHYAIRAENVLTRAGFNCALIPGPKEYSPNCGLALRFEFKFASEISGLLCCKKVKLDSVQAYRPRFDA